VPNVFWLGCIFVTSIAETKLYAEQNFTCMNINGQKRNVRIILLPEFLHTIFKCCFLSVLYLLITVVSSEPKLRSNMKYETAVLNTYKYIKIRIFFYCIYIYIVKNIIFIHFIMQEVIISYCIKILQMHYIEFSCGYFIRFLTTQHEQIYLSFE